MFVYDVQQFIINPVQQGGPGRIDELVVLVHVDPGPRGPGHLPSWQIILGQVWSNYCPGWVSLKNRLSEIMKTKLILTGTF